MARKWVIGGMVMAGLAVMAEAAGPATASSKDRVPDGRQLAVATRQMDELAGRDKSRDPATLLKLAGETTSSAALKYAATLRAIEQAADAGNVPLVVEGLDELEQQFDVDRHKLRLEAVHRLVKSPKPSAGVVMATRWLDDCYVAGRMDAAAKLAEVVKTGDSSKGDEIARAMKAVEDDFKVARGCFHEAATRPATLHATTRPGAGEVRVSPMFACLYQNAWEANLAALASGDDALASLAQEDVAANEPAARLKVADAWWSAGMAKGGLTGWRLARRAIMVYEKQLPKTDGVERELVLGRMAEHAAEAFRYQGYRPGVVRTIRKGVAGEGNSEVVTSLGLPKDQAGVEVPKSDAHVVWEGLLLSNVPGKYQLLFSAGTELAVTIDGRKLIDESAAYRKKSGIKCEVELTPGLHPIRIEVASSSSKVRLLAEWTIPGTRGKREVPAVSLFHDTIAGN